MGNWSVKDILAHVTTWEEEALKYLPLIITGGRPPRYIQYGGIDAFNAQMTEQKRGLALSDVLGQLDETHRRLLDYIRSVPEELCWLLSISVPKMSAYDGSTKSFSLQSTHQLDDVKVSFVIV